MLTVSRPSLADPTPSLALDPAPAGDRGFAVERAGVSGHLLLSARVATEYASEPLVLVNAAQERDAVVASQVWLHTLASFSIAHRLVLHVDVPVVMGQSGGAAPVHGATAPRADESAELGDLRLGARVKLLGTAGDAEVTTELALASWVWLPTAGDGYAGDGAVRVRGALILSGASRRLFWALDAGVRTRPSEELPGLLPARVGTALSLGLGAGFFADPDRDLALGTEAVADLTLTGGARFLDPRATVAHLFATAHYRVAGGPFEIGVAFGPGLGEGPGSSDFRALALVGYAPEQAAPPADGDGDGIPDKSDACVKLVGIPSPDPLLHGCPEAPADHDGDAIPDENDACPKVAGEPTGVRKTHGCPRVVDTDGDGVADKSDACPDEPGVPPPDGDGCPKPPEPPPATQLVEQQIVLSQQVQFETATAVLRPESDAVLAEVARVLAEHPEVELVEVQGHTDETGNPDFNRKLGQERAASVVAWLVAHGTAPARLVAKGYGSDVPLADNTTEEGRTKNRRVEFRVLRRAPSAPAAAPAPPADGGGP